MSDALHICNDRDTRSKLTLKGVIIYVRIRNGCFVCLNIFRWVARVSLESFNATIRDLFDDRLTRLQLETILHCNLFRDFKNLIKNRIKTKKRGKHEKR
jgi:hypothetical protein